MYVGKDFPLMNPDEVLVHAFDFSNDFLNGETIASAVWNMAVETGTPDAGADTHHSAPAISGVVASVQVSGLQAGSTYRIRALATSNLGTKAALHSFITCKAPDGTDT